LYNLYVPAWNERRFDVDKLTTTGRDALVDTSCSKSTVSCNNLPGSGKNSSRQLNPDKIEANQKHSTEEEILQHKITA